MHSFGDLVAVGCELNELAAGVASESATHHFYFFLGGLNWEKQVCHP